MSLGVWTLIAVVLSFGLYIGIAIWSRVNSTSGFYVAGRGIPAVFNGMATAADWMSAASFISMAGLISFLGFDGMVFLLGWTGGYVLLALLLAPYLRKFGKFTVPEFIGDRYYSGTARWVAALAAIVVSFTYVAGQMRGVGIVFSRFLQVDINTGVAIGMLIVAIYAVMGGMKGITWTQVAQYSVLIIAFLIPAIAISNDITGNPIPQLAFPDVASRLDGIQQELGFGAYTEPFNSGRDYTLGNVLLITLALMCGTAGLPHVIIRFYTAKSVRGARWTGFFALLFIAILYTTAPAVAAFAKFNLIETISGQPIADLPAWVANWQETGLLGINDENGDGLVTYVPGAGNELTIDRDIMVLANPEIAGLPNWVVALVVAGGLAAALSTASGLLLVIASSFSHDIYKRFIKPDASEANELLVARLGVVGAVLVAGYFGINPPGFVSEVVAFAFGLAAASFFPAIVLGIFDKRTNRTGAVTGMIVGIVFTAFYIITTRPSFGINWPYWFFGASPLGIGTIGMLFNFVITYTVSRMTEEPPLEMQEFVENIRYPRNAGTAIAHD